MRAGTMPRSLTQDYPGQFKQRNSPPGVLSAATPLRAGSTVKWSQQRTEVSSRAPVRIMGVEWTQNGLGMISRLPIDYPGVWLDSGMEGRFTGTIPQRWSQGLFSLVVMYASRFRNCTCTERNRIGGARKKRESQEAWGALRREIHAAQQALEARVGPQAVEYRPSFQPN